MLDPKLRALAGCPIIESEDGAMVFNPNPVITAPDDPTLAHEICHVLAGRDDYAIFDTACIARGDSKLFKYILNLLYDWYHESLYSDYSGYLSKRLDELHKSFSPYKKTGLGDVDFIITGYLSRKPIFDSFRMPHRKTLDAIDLTVIADATVEDLLKVGSYGLILNRLGIDNKKGQSKLSKKAKKGKSNMGSPKSDIGRVPKSSNYYITAVSRYFHIIEELTNLWKRNKYAWVNSYYGEMDWKNLPGMFQGEKMSLPVWRLFQKIAMSRKIYLVVDRSGSTHSISDVIMDTAVIIAESLRITGVPISILDVGVTHSIVNNIDEPLDMSWFTPMSEDGTPLGEVCSLITGADKDSYLLIVTDGAPDNWDTLKSALGAFPGSFLTFVIGDSYGSYMSMIGNTVHVEPHTIIREVIHNDNLS